MNNDFVGILASGVGDKIIDKITGGITDTAGKITGSIDSITSFDLGSYFQQMLTDLLNAIYKGEVGVAQDLYGAITMGFNDKLEIAGNTITKGFAGNNLSTAYNTVKALASTAFIPVAGVIMVVVLCWELVSIIQNYNSSNDMDVNRIFLLLFKLCFCILVCSRSFDIVTFFFDVGAWVSSKVVNTGQLNFNPLQYNAVLDIGNLEAATFGDIISMLGTIILLFVGTIAVIAIQALIYIKVLLWFVEFLIYSAPASIPFATWMNREWSQVGMNYVRKMLALAFEGPFMLLLFSMYGAIVTAAATVGGTDMKTSTIFIIGGCIAVYFMLKKIPQLAASIFSAH